MGLTIPISLRWGKKKSKETPEKPKRTAKSSPTTAKVKKTAVKPKTVAVKPKKKTVSVKKTPTEPKKTVKSSPTTAKVKKTAVKPKSAVAEPKKTSVVLAKNAEVRSYYRANYPTDDQWEEIRPNITFEDVMDCLKAGEDFYGFVGDGVDSVIRERIFESLASIYGVPYKKIYDMWLNGKEKPRYIPPAPQNPGMTTVPKKDTTGKAQSKLKTKRKSGYDFGPRVKGEITGAEFKAIAENMDMYGNSIPINKRTACVTDHAHVMMGIYTSKDDHSIFGLPDRENESEIYVESKEMVKAAKTVDPKKSYKVSTDGKNYILTNGAEIHSIPLAEYGGKVTNLLKDGKFISELTTEAELDADKLNKLSKRSGKVSDHMYLFTDGKDVFIGAKNDNLNGCREMRGDIGDITYGGNATAKYPADFMNDIAKHYKKDGKLKLKYSQDYPLMISSDRGSYESNVLLAPRIDNGRDKNGELIPSKWED